MPARKRQYTQTVTGTWAADSSGINVDIDKNGILTRIDMTAEMTPNITLDGANQPDGNFRVIQNTTIRGGSHTYVTLPADDGCMGGVLLHYLNRVDFRMGGHPLALITAPRRSYHPITFRYHFGTRPQDMFGRDNPFDLTAFIPANKESSVSFVIVTSGNDVMDDGSIINSGAYRFTLHIVQGSESDILEEMAMQGVNYPRAAPTGMVPAWVASRFEHTGTASDYSTERDLQTGGWLKRIALAFQDATGVRTLRAADEVTGVALKLPDQSEELIRSFADAHFNSLDFGSNSQADDGAPDFQAHSPHGLMYLDLRAYARGNSDYGLDLRTLRTGQVKLGFTISTYASGDDTLILEERYIPNPFATLS